MRLEDPRGYMIPVCGLRHAISESLVVWQREHDVCRYFIFLENCEQGQFHN